MNHAKLLDCTLRDGAYLLDKTFGDETIHGIIKGLIKAKIDYVEIGFFQNEGFGEGKTVYQNSSDARRFVPANKEGCCITVLADYSRYSVENLDVCTGDSVDAVRECFFKNERIEALEACRVIKEKGYKLFIQPVDILGYTDIELIEFLNMINELEPYCLSIVDTFGSMYQEDLHRVFEIVNHNLIPSCKIGFHSHNNMQLSNALSQEFVRMSVGKREVIVDGTLNGMGRGAGNTPTELVVQYMCEHGANYDMDAILDTIDGYMENISTRCTWGYTTQFFVAGCFSSHVNNIAYLNKKNSIRSKDIRYILNKIGAQARKRYDYDLLEKTYIELMQATVDDTDAIELLRKTIGQRKVLLLVPGRTVSSELDRVLEYIQSSNPIIISVNFLHDEIKSDYIYMSNVKRYRYWVNSERFEKSNKILTSNLSISPDEKTIVVSFPELVKCGWEHLDNSTIMLLRLLDIVGVSEIAIAGFDGYSYNNENYANKYLEVSRENVDAVSMNRELSEMLEDYMKSRNNKNTPVRFVTSSRFSTYEEEK